jgi:hypothetical protein
LIRAENLIASLLEAELADQLPTTATISSVSQFISDGHRWRHHMAFPMLG